MSTGSTDVRAIALDVDGTLLTDDHVIAESTVRAIADARRAGVRVILASARFAPALLPIARELRCDSEYFIGCQGAVIGKFTPDGGHEVVRHTRIDPYLALEVEEAAAGCGLVMSRFVGNHWFVRSVDDAIRRESAILNMMPKTVAFDVLNPDYAPHKLVVAFDPKAAPEELEGFAFELPPMLRWVTSHSYMLEITAAGVDKAGALAQLLELLDIPPSAVAAIGDGLNDLGMFDLVGVSVAMGNASEPVKAAATWTTESNTADGAALAIDRLLATVRAE